MDRPAEVGRAAEVDRPAEVGNSVGLGSLAGVAERALHKNQHDLDLGCNKLEGDSSEEPVEKKWYEFPFLLEL